MFFASFLVIWPLMTVGPPNSDIRGLRPCPMYQEWQVVGHGWPARVAGCRLGWARAFSVQIGL